MQRLQSETFPEGGAIPIKVAVIYNGVGFHSGIDTNHNMGKMKYPYTLDIGTVMSGLLHQRMPKIFSEVVFIPDMESLKPGYLALIPKNLSITTSNGKLSKIFRCGYTAYTIKGAASYSLLLATPQGDPIVEYSASDSQELADVFNAYCISRKQVGGAETSDYLALVEQAMKNVMARIERSIRGSGTITLYGKYQDSLPKDVLLDQWQHTIVLEKAANITYAAKDPAPFKTVAERVQIEMDRYLAPRSPDMTLMDIPERIEPPALPPLSESMREEITQPETDDEESESLSPAKSPLVLFPERRDLRIIKLQNQFRKAVEKRNQLLSNIKYEYKRELGTINKEQEAKKSLSMRHYFSSLRLVMLDVMGEIYIKQAAYDPASGKLMMTLEATKADYAINAYFEMNSDEADAIMQSAKDAAPVIEFSANAKGIRVSGVQLFHRGDAYEATLAPDDASMIALGTTFNYKTLSFTEHDDRAFAIQNPNLLDPSHLSLIAPAYTEDIQDKSFTEDLLQPMRLIPWGAPSPDKWLLAIGIENYEEADRVLFGARSYTLFVDVAQRALHIPKDHVLGVLNGEATAQGITSVFAELQKKAKAGDTIYFYYSGHIVRDPATNRMALLPKDMIPDIAISEGRFRLETVLETLMAINPARVIAFLDAGTSGKTDGSLAMKGLPRTPTFKLELKIDPTRLTLVTACRHDQSSNIFLEKRHRMFSYHLIKNLALNAESDLGAFLKKLTQDVTESSLRKQDIFRQDPQVYGNTKGRL